MKNQKIMKIGVVGSGAWGTALAIAFQRAGCKPLLWGPSSDLAEVINKAHENTYRLPGVALDPEIKATALFSDLAQMDAVVLAPPAQKVREVLEKYKVFVSKTVPLVIASKGIELGTGELISEIVKGFFPENPIAVLSGPSFAFDVAQKYPTAVTLAAEDFELGKRLTHALSSQFFRLYYSSDIIGAQVGGALKNVLALASGILEGKGFGANSRAALITRGLVEIQRLGVALGAKPETFYGLSGVGDLMLSCYSEQSRNMSYGMKLGRGEVFDGNKPLTEGVFTSSSVMILAKKHQVEMPICAAVDAIVNHGANVDVIIKKLLSRPLKAEA